MSTVGIAIVAAGVLLTVISICVAAVIIASLSIEEESAETIEPGTPVLVHTVDGAAIKGHVLLAGPDGVAVAGPQYLDGQNSREMGGVVRIPTDKVSWMQDLTGVGANGGGS
jgi:hypothetical protein